MTRALTDEQFAAIMRRRGLLTMKAPLEERTAEWFPAQRSFLSDPARLSAALCGRRSGKSRGGCLDMLLQAARTPHGRFLYLNETRAEAMKIAWIGLRGDGMMSLALELGLPVEINETNLTIHFPATDSWIYLMGADDEAGVRKALGLAYHLVWWDEAQKIPAKLEAVIRQVLMPTLLDYGGRLRLTGTPTRQMAGMFYNITRTDSKAKKWSVHRWNLMANPHFGRAVLTDDGWVVLDKLGARVGGPFATADEAAELVLQTRHLGGMQDLADLLEVALDSPVMRREGKGEWVKEDAAYVYDVHKVPRHQLCFAPARWKQQVIRVSRLNGEIVVIEERMFVRFPDIDRALQDLPGWKEGRDYFFALAADIGFNDPFAFTLAAWSLRDPALYEVASWGMSELDEPTQVAILRFLCDTVNVGMVAADAGGSALPTVKGWSVEWSTRYGIPVDEMEKTNKPLAIQACNGDIVRGRFRFRADGMLINQMGEVQWTETKTGTGKLKEDPTIPNDVADSGLYVHRRSFAHRFRPEESKPAPGSPEHIALEEQAMEDAADEQDELEVAIYWGN